MHEKSIVITSKGRNTFVIDGTEYIVDVTGEGDIARFLLKDAGIGGDLVWILENADRLFRTSLGPVGLLHQALSYARVKSVAEQNPKTLYYIAALWLIRYMGRYPDVYCFEKILN